MWQDKYVGSCLFGNDQDANFSESTSNCIWPRTAIAAGSYWGYYDTSIGSDSQRAKFNATFDAVQARLKARKISTCGCATLTSNGCSQMKSCSSYYCGPPPPPPPRAPKDGGFNSTEVEGYTCVDTASGQSSLAIATATVVCPKSAVNQLPEGEEAATSNTTAITTTIRTASSCSVAAAAACANHPGCGLFSIKLDAADLKAGKAEVSLFKRGAAPSPAPSTQKTFAAPCDPEDSNQRFSYDSATKQIVYGGEADGAGRVCVTALARCAGTPQLPLTPCTAGEELQQWEHTAELSFTPVSCAGHSCIDLYSGGKSTQAGLYSCSHTWNQVWQPAFSGSKQGTFEEVADGKCLSSAPPAPTRASLTTSKGSIAFLKQQ
jgi:hypothetical protein